jgi:hypothetical protein
MRSTFMLVVVVYAGNGYPALFLTTDGTLQRLHARRSCQDTSFILVSPWLKGTVRPEAPTFFPSFSRFGPSPYGF